MNKFGYEGVETQAIVGEEVHRLLIDRIFMSRFSQYKTLYIQAYDNASFEDVNLLKLNGSLAMAAYERTLMANEAPFQQLLRGNINTMSDSEKEGAKLFFGKANCTSCHNGPSLANMEFHALRMNDLKIGNYGNMEIRNVATNNVEHKGRGGFTSKAEYMYKFKVPELNNLKDSPFYGQGSSFYSIDDIIKYKIKALAENKNVSTSKLSQSFKPLNLTDAEI